MALLHDKKNISKLLDYACRVNNANIKILWILRHRERVEVVRREHKLKTFLSKDKTGDRHIDALNEGSIDPDKVMILSLTLQSILQNY